MPTSESLCYNNNFMYQGGDFWSCIECGAVFFGNPSMVTLHHRIRPPNATPPNEALQAAPDTCPHVDFHWIPEIAGGLYVCPCGDIWRERGDTRPVSMFDAQLAMTRLAERIAECKAADAPAASTSEPLKCEHKTITVGSGSWMCVGCGMIFGDLADYFALHDDPSAPEIIRTPLSQPSAPAASGEPSDERSAEWRAGYEAGKGRGADVCRSRSASLASGQQYTASNEAGKCARAIELADRGPDWLTAPAMTHEAVAALTESERSVSDRDCTRLMLLRRIAALRAEVEAGRRDVIRYDQTPDGCWVACIAGITGLPHDELAALVPRLESGRLDASMGTEYHNAVNAYLRARGWRLEGIGPDVPRGFAIGSGESPRGLSHAVVVKDGKLWHDPHPSRDGVKRVEFYEVLIPLTYSPAMAALSTPTSGASDGDNH